MVPLAEIPNAPQTAPMPLGDNLQGVNLMGAARLMQRNQIAQGSFDGPAEGMQALGRGLAVAGAGVGNALTRIAEAKMQADDDTHVMGATAVLNQTWADYQSSLAPGSDTNTWVPGWDDTLNKTGKQLLANKSLSPTAKALVQKELVRFRGQTMPRLTMSAAKESFDRSTKAHVATYEQQIEAGDIASAQQTVDAMLSKQLIHAEQADGLKYAAVRQGEINSALSAIAVDPIAAAAALDDEGKFKTISVAQRRQLQEEAARATVNRESTAFKFIAEQIKTGRIGTMEEAEDIGGKYLSPTTKMTIERMLEKEAPISYERVSTIRGRIDATDPVKDVTGQNRFELERDAAELPEPFRGDALKAIEDRYSGKLPSVPMSEVRQKLDAALNNGLLGEFNQKKVADGDVSEYAKREKAYQMKLKLEAEVEKWSRENPNADDIKRNQFLNERFRANGLMQPPEGFWERIRNVLPKLEPLRYPGLTPDVGPIIRRLRGTDDTEQRRKRIDDALKAAGKKVGALSGEDGFRTAAGSVFGMVPDGKGGLMHDPNDITDAGVSGFSANKGAWGANIKDPRLAGVALTPRELRAAGVDMDDPSSHVVEVEKDGRLYRFPIVDKLGKAGRIDFTIAAYRQLGGPENRRGGIIPGIKYRIVPA